MNPRQRRGLALGGILLAAVLFIWLWEPSSTAQIDSFNTCANAGYAITDSNPPICTDGVHNFTGPYTPVASPGPPITSVPFQILVSGDSRGSYPQTSQVITTQAQWAVYWSKVHAGLPTLPPILPVDFSSNNVLAINQGPETTGGYTITMTGIDMSATGTIIQVYKNVPASGCELGTPPSNEYLIVETQPLQAPISFDFSTNTRTCK